MFDIKWIRDHPEDFDNALKERGVEPISTSVLELDEKKRKNQTELQTLQNDRNTKSKDIGRLKSQGESADDLMREVADIKNKMTSLEGEVESLGVQLKSMLASLPNILSDDVPSGKSEEDNVEIRSWGEASSLSFDAKEHYELGEALGLMDFERAAKLSGSRFVVLQGGLARLDRALTQFMLDTHTSEFGYLETQPPFLVRDHVLFGTGQLPKFSEDLYKTAEDQWLIPTAEVPLTNLHSDEIIDADNLPLRFTAYTPCFRSEAGAAGRDTKGMLRQHQFMKVELVSIVKQEDGEAEHERMTKAAETILQRLEIPYRVMLLCSGDTGFSAKKTYDIEAWLPGQGEYREISSCSYCGDFQARRMKMRYREKDQKQTIYAHTLNGSGLALGRTLIAVMENYQQEDGSILVPEVLKPYMGGLDKICAS